MSHDQAAPLDPGEIRPRRWWYAIAAAVMVAGIAAGFVVALLGANTITGTIPEMKKSLPAGTATTVELSKDRDWAIYVAASDRTGSTVECSVESETGDADLSTSATTVSFTADGRTWQLAKEVSVTETGAYTFTCDSGDAATDLAIGEAVDVGGFVGGILGTIGGLLGIPCFAIVIGGVIILVVALRRSASRKRLRQGPAAPGAW